jgi:hypothetical protein
MDNHVHLLTESPRPSVTRRHLGVLLRGFSLWHNYHFALSSAPVHWDPIKNTTPIDSSLTLRQVIRYIHLNPCKAGMIRNPWLWEFSTLRDWEGASLSRWIEGPFLKRGTVLGHSLEWYQNQLLSDATRISDQVDSASPLERYPLETLSDDQIQVILQHLLSVSQSSLLARRSQFRDTYLQLRILRNRKSEDSLLRLSQQTGVGRPRLRELRRKARPVLREKVEFLSGTALASHWEKMPPRDYSRLTR